MSFRLASLAASVLIAAGCASPPPETIGPAAKETVFAVTASQRLVSFNGGQPQKLLSDRALTGLAPGERLLGIDYRVARGQLFALGSSGRLYRIDTATAALAPVGAPIATTLEGTQFGFDFNPTVDRIRVVSDAGLNLRLHPDTGAVVDGDPNAAGLQLDGRLAYDAADRNAGRTPKVAAAGYTYNQDNDKITTNFAIDAGLGALVRQGSAEGVQPAVSPNTGRLFTVGPLNAGPIGQVHFDISDVGNNAYAAITAPGAKATVLYRVDLKTGGATRIGTVAGGAVLAGLAIEP
ncbi:DUF4394 domain-containing protein [Aquincola sp. MAHUQ-54]|uniref:DUF4394 domain-containing protein n=1 Tax=Aquincola agrisoli TaxID=3119538 RepID=A0AAW9QJZ9_9BURK